MHSSLMIGFVFTCSSVAVHKLLDFLTLSIAHGAQKSYIHKARLLHMVCIWAVSLFLRTVYTWYFCVLQMHSTERELQHNYFRSVHVAGRLRMWNYYLTRNGHFILQSWTHTYQNFPTCKLINMGNKWCSPSHKFCWLSCTPQPSPYATFVGKGCRVV